MKKNSLIVLLGMFVCLSSLAIESVRAQEADSTEQIVFNKANSQTVLNDSLGMYMDLVETGQLPPPQNEEELEENTAFISLIISNFWDPFFAKNSSLEAKQQIFPVGYCQYQVGLPQQYPKLPANYIAYKQRTDARFRTPKGSGASDRDYLSNTLPTESRKNN